MQYPPFSPILLIQAVAAAEYKREEVLKLKNFHFDFFQNLTSDELNTIFFTANNNAKILIQNPVLQNYPPEDARIMALSFAIATEIIDRYDNVENI